MNSSGLYIGLALTALLPPALSLGDTIYTCREERSTSIAWEEGGFFRKEGLRAEANNGPGNVLITIVAGEKKGTLKGNLGQTDLVRISDSVLLEHTASGNMVSWTVLKGKGKIPTYVIQQKAYDLMGPYSITVAWKCE
jgi:hypothetical protein